MSSVHRPLVLFDAEGRRSKEGTGNTVQFARADALLHISMKYLPSAFHATCWKNVGRMLEKCWENVAVVYTVSKFRCWKNVGKMSGKCWENVSSVHRP